ncbi:MAG: Carboxylesterase NlhH [Paracidovorax wautersii]|uniref:Carboxylesterase NlhH n=1 Tax=Paracidovorax wautersii TaxID=1177982 RepID=A0A7V8JPC9_9BURK|nr:MAG: Carboxylesterase NlhH [Paracidovorax wautersii]
MLHQTEADKYTNPVTDTLSKALAALRAEPQMLALARAYESLEPKAIEKLSVEEARSQPTIADAIDKLLREQGRSTDPAELFPGVESRDTQVPGATGPLPARIYQPRSDQPLPIILFFHGGGWVVADKAAYDGSARGLALETHAMVVSLDYRQAPEHKFPAAWDDALAVYRWLQGPAANLGGDPERLALAGESAGGTLALATAIAARDAQLRPPAHVACVYPLAQTSLYTESHLENAIAKPLNRAMVSWFLGHLVNSPADLADPRLSLLDAELHGLPPVTIVNAGIDPLRADGSRLQATLELKGNNVRREIYTGMAHEFFGAAAVLDTAREAQRYIARRLIASFGHRQVPR